MSIVGLVFGTALLVGLKTTALGPATGVAADAPLDPAASGAPGTGPGGTVAGPAAGPGKSAQPGTTPGRTSGPTSAPRPGTTTPAPGHTTSTTTAPPPGGGGTTTAPPPSSVTVTGAAISVPTAESPTAKSGSCGNCHNYAISVTLTVSGGRITKATTSYSTSPGASQSYADQASSSLQSKILSSQTWNLGRVSGATYSGNAWEQSARDAMSKAGLPV
ncbi:MAG: hypothetical protein ACM3JP_00465 [Betaproteobacteria bacterium]